MKFIISNRYPRKRPPVQAVRQALQRLHLPSIYGKHKISIVWVNNRSIAQLAGRFRGEAHATDVLSFPMSSFDDVGGEIIISLDRALSQAKERGVPFAHELILLVTHGLLHLMGFGDETMKEWGEMRIAEFQTLMKIL